MHGAALAHALEARADLHALDRIDAHHRVGNVGIQLVKQRLAQAHRHAAGLDDQLGAAGIPVLAQLVHIGFQRVDLAHVGRKERVVGHMLPALKRDGVLTQLRHAGADLGAELLAQPLLGHRTGGHHRGRHARRRAPAAARIADAVLVPVGVVGMAGTEGLQDVAVVLAALVGVADQQRNRGARGLALVDTAQDLDGIRLVALGHMARGARTATVQIGLEVRFRQGHARRAAIDDAADRRAVRFAEIRDREQKTEGAACHRAPTRSAKGSAYCPPSRPSPAPRTAKRPAQPGVCASAGSRAHSSAWRSLPVSSSFTGQSRM